MGKDVGLRIRLERALRDEFLEACRAQDRPAAQVLREFMREYVRTNGDENEGAAPRPTTYPAPERKPSGER